MPNDDLSVPVFRNSEVILRLRLKFPIPSEKEHGRFVPGSFVTPEGSGSSISELSYLHLGERVHFASIHGASLNSTSKKLFLDRRRARGSGNTRGATLR